MANLYWFSTVGLKAAIRTERRCSTVVLATVFTEQINLKGPGKAPKLVPKIDMGLH